MSEAAVQKTLSSEQIEAFYHSEFVEEQSRDFDVLVPGVSPGAAVVDVGGGCGYFAKRLAEAHGYRTRVIDMDPTSVAECRRAGVEAVVGDALAPPFVGDEEVVVFNVMLHHLIGASEAETRALQVKALKAWHGRAKAIFVYEYIYESYVANLSGRLMYEITKSKVLSWMGRQAAKVIPAFHANTFGVGVRFRAHDEWKGLFAEAGYRVAAVQKSVNWPVSVPLRALLISHVRRDSFRLEAA